MCPFFCNAPDDPSTPFGNPSLVFFDAIRVLVFILSAWSLVGTAIILLGHRGTFGQLARLFGAGGFVTMAVWTEIVHFGDYANGRLVINILASVVYAWGIYSRITQEEPATYRVKP